MASEYIDVATGDTYFVEVRTRRPVCMRVTPAGQRSVMSMVHHIPLNVRPDVLAERERLLAVDRMPPKLENPSLVHYVPGGCGHNPN